MDLFKTDLPAEEIAALQDDQDRQEKQRQLDEQIERRKREMDIRNRKMNRVAARTANAKHIVF